MIVPPVALARSAVTSYFWGLVTTLVAAPIAGFASIVIFARLVLARGQRPATEDQTGPTETPRPAALPSPLLFAASLLLISWGLGFAWPAKRAYPWYHAGTLTMLLGLTAVCWWGARRLPNLRFPAAWHPGAIQSSFTQLLHEAVAQGRIPAGHHGELVILVRSDETGRAPVVTISGDPPVPPHIRTLASRLLANLPPTSQPAIGGQFTLRY